jgi:hypothetical protein
MFDRDMELDFIREFATGGELPQGLSSDDRRERIRVAIYTQELVYRRFRDTAMTYAGAYEKCFGQPLEMRRTVRHKNSSS